MLLTGNRSMAGVITLYDGASGVTPNQYNAPSQWLNFGSVNPVTGTTPIGTQSVSGGLTNLDTSSSSSNAIYGGYSNYNVANPPVSPFSVITPTTLVNSSFPSLDRNAGYDLSFTVKINSQFNDGTNGPYRAGFSVIVLSSDKQGIEIGFRNTDIFAQVNSSFNSISPAEQITSVSSLLSSLTTYDLNVSGNNYTLTNGATTLLSGLLRDYTAASGVGSDVYKTPNFVFLGDDTTSARANIGLQSITLTNNSAGVPYEFSPTAGIFALVAGSIINHLLKKKKS